MAPGPKASITRPKSRALAPPRRGGGQQPLQFNDRRNEQDLPFNATRQTRGFHLFIDKTFMRGVLIDNDETVACLRDDVSAVDLRPRRAKRRIVIVVQRHCGAHIGARVI